MAELIHVQLCYALPQAPYLIDLPLPAGSSIVQAIEASDILQRFPEIDLAVNKVGLFGKLKTLDTLLRDGDRIEIYRALQADPKESRRRRARHQS